MKGGNLSRYANESWLQAILAKMVIIQTSSRYTYLFHELPDGAREKAIAEMIQHENPVFTYQCHSLVKIKLSNLPP